MEQKEIEKYANKIISSYSVYLKNFPKSRKDVSYGNAFKIFEGIAQVRIRRKGMRSLSAGKNLRILSDQAEGHNDENFYTQNQQFLVEFKSVRNKKSHFSFRKAFINPDRVFRKTYEHMLEFFDSDFNINIPSEFYKYDTSKAHKLLRWLQSLKSFPVNLIGAYNLDETKGDWKPILTKSQRSYLSGVVDSTKSISLNIVEFNLPVEKIIELPLLNNNEELIKRRTALEKQLENAPEELGESIKVKLDRINKALTDEHPLLELANTTNLFVESIAGSGKTTMLKWLTYSFAKKALTETVRWHIPVFSEMRFYSSESELEDFILKDVLMYFPLSTTRQEYKFLFVLDGIDEYKGDIGFLLSTIKGISNDYKCNFVLSGRQRPSLEFTEIPFEDYRLKPLNEEQMKYLFKYSDPDNGLANFNLLKKNNVVSLVDRPLYLIMISTHFKNGNVTIEQARGFLHNRGLLFKTVLVDTYIKKYEKTKTPTAGNWELIKTQQIELISYLAYFMTYHKGDAESISKKEANEEISKYLDTKMDQEQLSGQEVLYQFSMHNILQDLGWSCAFAKKEFRLFFTALFLKNNITSISRLQEYHKSFLKKADGKSASNKDSSHPSWESVERFVFGILDPSTFSDELLLELEEPFVLTSDFVNKVLFIVKLLDQKNYPQDKSTQASAFISEVCEKSLLEYSKVDKRDTGRNSFFELLFVWKVLPLAIAPKRIYSRINYKSMQPLTFFGKDYLQTIVEFLIKYSYGQTIYDVERIITPYGDILDYYLKKVSGYNSKLLLRLIPNEIIYNYEFLMYRQHRYLVYTTRILSDYVERFIGTYSTDLLEHLFDCHPKPSFREYVRFFNRVVHGYYMFGPRSIKFSRLNLQIKTQLLQDFVWYSARARRESQQIKIFDISINLNGSFTSDLTDRLIQEFQSTTDPSWRENISGVMVRIGQVKDLNFYIENTQSDNREIRTNALYGLMHFTSYFRKADDKNVEKIMPIVLPIMHSSPGNLDSKISIVHAATMWRCKVSPQFNSVVVDMFNTAGEEFKIFGLRYFEYLRVSEAVPTLIKHLNQNTRFSTEIYHTLFEIDTKYHFKYANHEQVCILKRIVQDQLEAIVAGNNNNMEDARVYSAYAYELGIESAVELLDKMLIVKKGEFDLRTRRKVQQNRNRLKFNKIPKLQKYIKTQDNISAV